MPVMEELRPGCAGPPARQGVDPNPASKAKSVVLNRQDLRDRKRLFLELFGARGIDPGWIWAGFTPR
jgi:hypothetical protein